MSRGRSRRAMVTPWWVFALHLAWVFACTWGGIWLFSVGEIVWGVVCAAGWLAAFTMTATDNIRIPWFQWVGVMVMPWVDTLRSTGESKSDKEE